MKNSFIKEKNAFKTQRIGEEVRRQAVPRFIQPYPASSSFNSRFPSFLHKVQQQNEHPFKTISCFFPPKLILPRPIARLTRFLTLVHRVPCIQYLVLCASRLFSFRSNIIALSNFPSHQ